MMAVGDSGHEVVASPFPASTKTTSGTIKSIPTTVTSVYFADKIVITVAQNGRLSHWAHVPLDLLDSSDPLPASGSARYDDDLDLPPSDLLPAPQLTATSILGGTIQELETLGQLLATQIATAIVQRNSREKRLVVVGMGLEKRMSGREEFAELVGLVLEVL